MDDMCSFQVDATRTKKDDESPHERHDIYTTILFFFHFETYIPNGSEKDTSRCDVVTHH